MRLFLPIALATTTVLAALEIIALQAGNHYKYDFFVLLAGLWLLYALRQRLNLHPAHFALAAFFLIAHNLGVFGTYDRNLFGIEYDTYVHFYFGIVAGLIATRSARLSRVSAPAYLFIPPLILIFSLGHELVEAVGGWLLGHGQGLFLLGPGDLGQHDTLSDILNNLFGTLTAMALYGAYVRFRP